MQLRRLSITAGTLLSSESDCTAQPVSAFTSCKAICVLQTELDSFLIEISALIFGKADDKEGKEGWLLDKILDKTGMKGTGEHLWGQEPNCQGGFEHRSLPPSARVNTDPSRQLFVQGCWAP